MDQRYGTEVWNGGMERILQGGMERGYGTGVWNGCGPGACSGPPILTCTHIYATKICVISSSYFSGFVEWLISSGFHHLSGGPASSSPQVGLHPARGSLWILDNGVMNSVYEHDAIYTYITIYI